MIHGPLWEGVPRPPGWDRGDFPTFAAFRRRLGVRGVSPWGEWCTAGHSVGWLWGGGRGSLWVLGLWASPTAARWGSAVRRAPGKGRIPSTCASRQQHVLPEPGAGGGRSSALPSAGTNAAARRARRSPWVS